MWQLIKFSHAVAIFLPSGCHTRNMQLSLQPRTTTFSPTSLIYVWQKLTGIALVFFHNHQDQRLMIMIRQVTCIQTSEIRASQLLLLTNRNQLRSPTISGLSLILGSTASTSWPRFTTFSVQWSTSSSAVLPASPSLSLWISTSRERLYVVLAF